MLGFIVLRVIPESHHTYYKDVFRHLEKLCSARLDGYLQQSDLDRLPMNLRSTIKSIFTRYAHESSLSLLDFIIAIYDLSAILVSNKVLCSAFALMNGCEKNGISVQQLRSSLCGGRSRVSKVFINDLKALNK